MCVWGGGGCSKKEWVIITSECVGDMRLLTLPVLNASIGFDMYEVDSPSPLLCFTSNAKILPQVLFGFDRSVFQSVSFLNWKIIFKSLSN